MTRLTTVEVADESNETKVGWHRVLQPTVVFAPAHVLAIIFVEGRISFLQTHINYGTYTY